MRVERAWAKVYSRLSHDLEHKRIKAMGLNPGGKGLIPFSPQGPAPCLSHLTPAGIAGAEEENPPLGACPVLYVHGFA